jgi:hypothetical protein
MPYLQRSRPRIVPKLSTGALTNSQEPTRKNNNKNYIIHSKGDDDDVFSCSFVLSSPLLHLFRAGGIYLSVHMPPAPIRWVAGSIFCNENRFVKFIHKVAIFKTMSFYCMAHVKKNMHLYCTR